MLEALKEAQKAFDVDEVPVGSVIVANNKIILFILDVSIQK